MANKCKPKLSDRCLTPMNAACVDYDGILLETTTLDPDDCNTVEDVIEDITNQVDENTTDLNFTEFESCLTVEASDEDRGVTIKDVISVHDITLCNIQEQLENLRNPDEPECQSECCDDDEGCCSILKKYDALSSNLTSNQDNWTPTTVDELKYKASKIGTYKFTFELGISPTMLTTQTTYVGLSLNGLDPESNLFEQVLVTAYNNNTVTFVKKMLTNDTARFATKGNGSAFLFNYVKMVVEKVK